MIVVSREFNFSDREEIRERRKYSGTRLYYYYYYYYLTAIVGWHPVAAVQYTFTHKQYTEYRGRSTHNN
jgi:hypothetical protein